MVARLKEFKQIWTEHIEDAWTLFLLKHGHKWSFIDNLPRNHFQPTRLPSSPDKTRVLLKYVVELEQKGAILEVPTPQRGRKYYSPLFLVEKKTGDLRPVLDLKGLNKRIQIEAFKMESLQSILLAKNLRD